MASRWTSTTDSINEYVNVLRDSNVEGKITFIAFDLSSNSYIRSMQWGNPTIDIAPVFNNSVIEVVRDGTSISEWAPLTGHEVSPRGSTPLFDAVIETKKMIEADTSEKGILLIMTDGQENASKNRKEVAEGTVGYVKNRGWEVVFLGANFDVAADAGGLGIAPSSYASFTDSNATRAMNLTATKSALYATTGASMAFYDADKAAMTDED